MIDSTLAEHYHWGQDCDGWHLVRSDSVSVIQERMPAQTAEVRHFHSRSRQFFFVLSGRATIEIDGQRQALGMHQGVEVAPGVPHQIANESGEDLNFLVVSCPPSHGDRSTV